MFLEINYVGTNVTQEVFVLGVLYRVGQIKSLKSYSTNSSHILNPFESFLMKQPIELDGISRSPTHFR